MFLNFPNDSLLENLSQGWSLRLTKSVAVKMFVRIYILHQQERKVRQQRQFLSTFHLKKCRNSCRTSVLVMQAADRSGLSIRQQLLIQSTIVTSSGGSFDKMSMSVLTVWRQRRTARVNTVVIIREKGCRQNPNFEFFIGI